MTHSVLIVGVGSIGERHLRCFAATGRARISLCEVNPTLRETVAARYSVEGTFGHLEDALRARPEVVVVCTPANSHLPIALAAARAGAHLLIEKPLSTSFDGLELLQQECAQRKLTAAVAYVYRAHPVLAAMREAIRSGRFGEPVQIVAKCGQHFPLYRPAYREIYYRDRATGGGAVQDAITHMMNAGEWLVGPVDRLVADLDHQVLEGVTVEDTVHVLTRHGGVMGCFSLNQHQAPNDTTITVVCRGGTVRFEAHENRWRWMTEPGGAWHDEACGPVERDTPFIRQAEAFLDTVEGRHAPLCSLEEGAQTLRVNLAILASAETGAWQSLECGSLLPLCPRTPSEGSPSPGDTHPDKAGASSRTPHPTPQPTVSRLFDLTGRTALITGASGHLGAALAEALAEAGARVIVASRSLDKARATAAALGPQHLAVEIDQLDEGSIERGFADAVAQSGGIDVLVNNGHAVLGADWRSVTGEDFTKHLGNATGYFLLARALRDHAAGRGAPASIIFLGSMYGQVASYPEVYEGLCAASPAAYHALKGGLIHLTRHLAVYWAKDNVRVNCLSPGPFPSPAVSTELTERLRERSPMARLGQPHELKGALVFLASDASSYVTGHNLNVDGGWTAW